MEARGPERPHAHIRRWWAAFPELRRHGPRLLRVPFCEVSRRTKLRERFAHGFYVPSRIPNLAGVLRLLPLHWLATVIQNTTRKMNYGAAWASGRTLHGMCRRTLFWRALLLPSMIVFLPLRLCAAKTDMYVSWSGTMWRSRC